MKRYIRILWAVIAVVILSGCGGGGGGSSSQPAAATPPDPPPSGGDGGGSSPPVDQDPPSGGDGGDSNPPADQEPPNPTPDAGGSRDTPTVDNTLGLVSGAAGLASGSGVDGVALVGVSGTGLAVGVSGTGLSVGTIQSFGSIVINDESLDTDTASFTISGLAGSQAELRQGQHVLIIGDITAGIADAVIYRPNIVARLDSLTIKDATLGLATGSALAQDLEFDAATVYENTEFELLSAGLHYEISAIVEQGGGLRVTFIRPTSTADLRLVGEIENLDDATFTLNGLTVDADNASLIDFEDNELEEHDVVAVEIDPNSFNVETATATAISVTLLPRVIIGQDAPLKVEGLVDNFVSATEFSVQNQPITTNSNTRFFNGEAEDIALDSRLLVIGRVDSTGTLLAQRIFLEASESIFLVGMIEAIDLTLQTITVSSVVFEVRALTDFDEFEDLDELQVGDLVSVVGYVDGSASVAAEVELLDQEEDDDELRGPAVNIDAAAGTFTILGVDITTSAATTTFEADEDPLTQSQFFALLQPFDFVTVTWAEGATTADIAESVSLDDDD
ncbi:MAG: DUF5666 domain-containing protein [Pseudomonadota bacterium]